MLKEDTGLDNHTEEIITEMLSLILTKNSFEFNNEHFLQIHGTAMGSPMAPTYANIFMAVLEKQMLLNAPDGLTPIEWIRCTDDNFLHYGPMELKHSTNFLTNIMFHLTIKLDYTYSSTSVNFLDTTIYINNHNQFESDLYIKPTDRTLLLHNYLFHPTSCKNSIILSQPLRYRHLITDNKRLQQRLDHLCVMPINRGYKKVP